MLKKILYYIGIILFILFIYLNYIKPPEKVKKQKEENLVTSSVTYDVKNYHLEAKKEIDNSKTKERIFKKATAFMQNLKLYGDYAVVDKINNLDLKNNILAVSNNGWNLEAQKADYNYTTKIIHASDRVKAYNKKQGITIYGDSLITDDKLTDLNFKNNIRALTDKMQLSANYAHYNNKTQILEVKENVGISGRKLGSMKNFGLLGHFNEVIYNGITKIVHGKGEFTLYFRAAKFKAKDFYYNEVTGDFTVYNDVVIEYNGGEIKAKKLNYVAAQNKMYITGPLRGKYKNYQLEADGGVYDTATNRLNIDGHIKVYNRTTTLKADNGVYYANTSDLYLTSKTLVSYKNLDEKLLTKKLYYNDETKQLKLLNSYTYSSKEYQSVGKEFYYNSESKKGKIIDGTIISTKTRGSAKEIDFNRKTKIYIFNKNAKIYYGDQILTSQNIYIDNLKQIVLIKQDYKIYNSKYKSIFYGQNARYDISSGDLISKGDIKIIKDNKIVTGQNLNYNSKTSLGTVEKQIHIVDDAGNDIVGDSIEFNSKKYINILGNLKVKTKDTILYADRGEYKISQDRLYLPGKIKIVGKNSVSNMRDGVYSLKDKTIKGSNFYGVSDDKKARGDEVIYNIPEQSMLLYKNVVVQNLKIQFVGSQLEYYMNSEDMYSSEKYKIYYQNYIMDGETIKGNMKNKILDGTKTTVTSSDGENFYGDFMFGDLNNKQFNLEGNVHALAYYMDKKNSKKEPVKISGEIAKIFLYRNKFGKLAISRVEIKKDGVYKYKNMIMNSDYMEIDLINKLALGKKGNHINIAGKTDVNSDIMEFNMKTEIINLIDNVQLKNVDKSGKIMEASSDKGELINKTQIAILKENVIADTTDSHTESNYAKYNMKTGILNAVGNVRIDYKK